MRALVCAALTAASVMGWNVASAKCPSASDRNCIVNFGLPPGFSRRIVADEPLPVVPAKSWQPDAKANYTGPTIGAAPVVGRAPEVGYRWAIN